jgi:N-acetyl sugar amidotransferase
MSEYRICTVCVMDSSAGDIEFDASGVCNYCRDFRARMDAARTKVSDRRAARDAFLNKVREAGAGKEYDCIVGVSGGLDSSYALYVAVQNGLRPLAVHLDNGWNSELAAHNIASMVRALGVDLVTHVIDWEENRDLQLSFFKADVVDIEMLMDNAMLALNYREASRHGLKYILSGVNSATEGMVLPRRWTHYKRDERNIRAIHRRFGRLPIRTHPLLSTLRHAWYELVRRIRFVSFLDYFDYEKAQALAILQKEVGYKAYPYKHYESVFTRFYQAHILPRKFGFDKRRVHLSTLIISGQLSRDEALRQLELPPYPDPQQEEQDRLFVMKKLGFTEAQFEDYLNRPPVPHAAFKSELGFYETLVKVYRAARAS